MPLLNYTTEIGADKSIAQIQKNLAEHGARAIMSEYDNEGYITSLSFQLMVNEQMIGFKLPSDWRPVLQILEQQRKRNSRVKATQEQALRVSWRILKDWVEAQMAIIETKMVKPEQVFLPYVITKSGETLYEQVAKNKFLLGGV